MIAVATAKQGQSTNPFNLSLWITKHVWKLREVLELFRAKFKVQQNLLKQFHWSNNISVYIVFHTLILELFTFDCSSSIPTTCSWWITPPFLSECSCYCSNGNRIKCGLVLVTTENYLKTLLSTLELVAALLSCSACTFNKNILLTKLSSLH
jgi:hypothetical protein